MYLDDILIYSAEPAEYWQHVQQVLKWLRQFSLFANLKKCQFSTERVKFLGFIISTEGVEMDQKRVATIRDWPRLKTFRDV